MNLYVIGDYLTVKAFALAGIKGKVIAQDTPPMELKSLLQECIRDPEISIVIINKFAGTLLGQDFEEYLNMNKPLFMEVPDSGQELKDEDIRKYIQQVIGVRI